MAAINTSISYQSQFATPNSSLIDMLAKSAAQEQMEQIKGADIKPISHTNSLQGTTSRNELGQHVNLKAQLKLKPVNTFIINNYLDDRAIGKSKRKNS